MMRHNEWQKTKGDTVLKGQNVSVATDTAIVMTTRKVAEAHPADDIGPVICP